jgi:hypothetical protein
MGVASYRYESSSFGGGNGSRTHSIIANDHISDHGPTIAAGTIPLGIESRGRAVVGDNLRKESISSALHQASGERNSCVPY